VASWDKEINVRARLGTRRRARYRGLGRGDKRWRHGSVRGDEKMVTRIWTKRQTCGRGLGQSDGTRRRKGWRGFG
jgi:hypothetical protein